MDHREVANEAIRILSRFPEVERIVLYGSVLRGDYTRGADIDLAFVTNDLYKGMPLDSEGIPFGLVERIRKSLEELERSSGILIQAPFYWASDFEKGEPFPQENRPGRGQILKNIGKVVYSAA